MNQEVQMTKKRYADGLVGSAVIAERLGVSPSTPRTWKCRYSDYPAEVVPGYWNWADIENWYESGLANRKSA